MTDSRRIKATLLEKEIPRLADAWINCTDKSLWPQLNKRYHAAESQLSYLKEILKKVETDEGISIFDKNKDKIPRRKLNDEQRKLLINGLKIRGITEEDLQKTLDNMIREIEGGFLSRNKDGTVPSIDISIKQAIRLYDQGRFACI